MGRIGKYEVGGAECRLGTQEIVGGLRVYAGDETQHAEVVDLEEEAEVTGPRDVSDYRASLVLARRGVEAQFEDRFCVHRCARTEFRVYDFLAKGQRRRLGLSLLGPVAVVGGEKIFLCVENSMHEA